MSKRRRTTSKRRTTKRPTRRTTPLSEIKGLRKQLAAQFPQPRLSVELVPRPLWGKSCASVLTEGEWKRLRTPTYQRAGWRCVICGGKGPTYPVVCHEVWEYDDTALVQRLAGLMAICP